MCEVLIEYPIQSKFLGRKVTPLDLESQLEFWIEAGYDFIPLTVGMMTPGRVTQESAISKVLQGVVTAGSGVGSDDRTWNLEYTSFIHNRADFERFPWEAAAQTDIGNFHATLNILPDGMKVIAVSGKIFTLTWMLMGFNHFAMSLIMNERLVADVFCKVAEIQFGALEQILEMPHVGAVWAVDDLAWRNGPMISPRALRDHVFPWYREMAARCHKKGILFFLHSDGNMMPIIPDLIDLGLDALHPIDPTCLDILRVKEMYGDHLCLIGNVSNELLRSASSNEVETVVKELIRQLAPGGGYCVGSGNSVTEWTRFENFMAMREATFRFGHYPIRFHQ